MRNLAYAILDGNLTADPETKTVGNGKKVSTFSLAVNHFSKEDNHGEEGAANNEVSYIDIEAWDKVAENCSEFLKKGRQRWKIIASTVRFDGFGEKAGKEYREYRERKAA